MKKTHFILLLFLASIVTLNAQHKGNYDQEISRQNILAKASGNSVIYNPNPRPNVNRSLNPSSTIVIDVKALQNVKASSYTAVFNVSQIGETAEITNKLMSDRISNIKKELATYGILEKDIAVDVISFVPVYEVEVTKKLFSTKYNEIPKGFELQQNINIQFKKTQQFENVLTACANSEIYNLVKVDYFIDNIAEVYKNLQTELLKLIKDKKDYYNILGFNLDEYNATIADDKYCYFPKSFYKSYQAYNSISFEALKKQKNLTTAKKQTSYYYDPISYENYDVVINSAILEPVVQIGMDIKLHYTPKPKEKVEPVVKTETKHKYYVISPDGKIDVKELNL